ncbi:MAG: hypothetical protein IKI67_06315, partial [Bacteroidales bacterium]|nr:hypothetical protein [Bacteroidales bacterium]
YNPELTKYGYMYAGTKVAKENVPASTVNLEFTPNFTAYEFNLTDNKSTALGEKMILKSLTIESDNYLAAEGVSTILQFDGSDNISFYSQLPTEATDKSKKIVINFKKSDGTDALPITLPTGGNYLKFTILTLGKTSSGYQTDVKIKFEMEQHEARAVGLDVDIVNRTLTLPLIKKDGSNLAVTEGYKVLISNLGMSNGSLLSTDIDAVDVSSADAKGFYPQKIKVTSKTRETTPVAKPWTIYYVETATDGTETEYGYDTEEWPNWIAIDKNKGTDAEEEVTITVAPGQLEPGKITSPAGSVYIDNLKNATAIGTYEAPRDLSLYDIYGNLYPSSAVSSITTSGSHTANCYVVSAPGYYCFPLVYGNAIGYTAVNPDAATLEKAYKGYKNADNGDITKPYILEDLSYPNAKADTSKYEAVVIWQDVHPGAEVILDKSLSVINAPSGAGLSDCKYIRFSIDKERILPVNAVVALRQKSDKKILWSWHIWVAPVSEDFYKTSSFKYLEAGSTTTEITATILNSNLGWTAPLKYAAGTTKAKTAKLRIRQDGTNTYKDIAVDQASYTTDPRTGKYFSSNYYQWGRKDPFIGVHQELGQENGDTQTDKPYSSQQPLFNGWNSSQNTSHSLSGSDMGVDISKWIQNPNSYNKSQTFSDDIIGISLWNYSQKTGSQNSNIHKNYTRKTIYDPSPAGFCVPPSRFASGFTANGGSSSDSSTKYGEFAAQSGALPVGAKFTNNHTAGNYNLYFPKMVQRTSGLDSPNPSGRINGSNNSDYWTSCSNLGSSQNRTIFRFLVSTTLGTITPGSGSINLNQACVVRPALEQK